MSNGQGFLDGACREPRPEQRGIAWDHREHGERDFFKGGATTEKAFCLPPYLGCSQQAPGGSSHLISTRMPSGEGIAVEPLCGA